MEPAKLTSDLFEPLPLARVTPGRSATRRKRAGFWRDALRRFVSNKGALIGFILLLMIIVLTVAAPMVSPHDPYEQNLVEQNRPPDGSHYFGTDQFGRDLWTRTWHGAGISLQIGLLAALIDLVVGVSYGGISGYFGGKTDQVMQRILEVMYSIPSLIVLILLMMWFEPGIVTIAIAIALTGWVPMARVVRGQMLQLKVQEFVLAARTLGAGHLRMLAKHLLPNAAGAIIVTVTLTIPSAIFLEAVISFIGLGMAPPEPSLGLLLYDSYQLIRFFPHQILYPCLVLSLLILGFNLLGDGLRDALDPKLRR
jgi:oligopeptide transport system permease protein